MDNQKPTSSKPFLAGLYTVKIPSWKEVAEGMIKNAALALGQDLLTKQIIPNAGTVAKKVWERAKSTKQTTKTPPTAEKQYRQAQTVRVDFEEDLAKLKKKSRIVDAQFKDEQE